MSEHEGFGVPLVEAMIMGVPVLARRAAAVGFTLGEGGVTFEGRDLAEIAELARLLAAAGELRSAGPGGAGAAPRGISPRPRSRRSCAATWTGSEGRRGIGPPAARPPGAGGAPPRRRGGPRGPRDPRSPPRGRVRTRRSSPVSPTPASAAEVRPLREYAGEDGEGTVCLCHFSPGQPRHAGRAGGGGTARRRLPQRHPRAVLRRLVRRVPPASPCRPTASSRRWRAAPRSASPRARSAWETSRRSGFAACGVLPFVHEPRARAQRSPVFDRLYADGRTHLLAVGRLAPNKRLEDLLRAFAFLQRGPVPRSRLLLVGDDGLRGYAGALRALARGLRLREVAFCGHVEEDELRSAYGLADVLVSLSEHEGYGVPLVEAMLAGVPVVAYDAGAVAETMGGAGILLGEKRPELVAGVVESLLRRSRAAGGRARRTGEGGGAHPRHGLPGPGPRRAGARAGGGGNEAHPRRFRRAAVRRRTSPVARRRWPAPWRSGCVPSTT